MPYKKLDDLRKELGLAQKGTRSDKGESFTTVHLHMRLKTEDAKNLLVYCDKQGTSESLFARTLILEKLERIRRER